MHTRMDEISESEKETMCRLVELKTLDVYWKKFSEYVEKHGLSTWEWTRTQQRG